MAVVKYYGTRGKSASTLAGSVLKYMTSKGSVKGKTALYTYLEGNLKSPRLRRILEEGAVEHGSEKPIARRA